MLTARHSQTALLLSGRSPNARSLKTLLFGVQPLDVLTFLTMSGLLLAIALIASYFPAQRASAVDPMRSLRTWHPITTSQQFPSRGGPGSRRV